MNQNISRDSYTPSDYFYKLSEVIEQQKHGSREWMAS